MALWQALHRTNSTRSTRWITARSLAWLVFTGAAALPCRAFDSWGGSVGLTSDYLVRGISRSNHDPAVQADLHFRTVRGLIGGLFASTEQISSRDPRNVELSAFLGLAWNGAGDWRARLLATHYSDPWSEASSNYSYDELSVDAGYQDWLNLSLVYSPNARRYVPYVGLIGVSAKTVEISVYLPWRRQFAATAGVGYSHYAGPEGSGFAYGSLGVVYDRAPWSAALSFVTTSDEAKYLFYNAAAHDRWLATLIWRF